MSRALVLIGAFIFFRSILHRTVTRSPNAITPYMNALDGMMSSQEVSSVLDEIMPHNLWQAHRRAELRREALGQQLGQGSAKSDEHVIYAPQSGPTKVLRP